MRPLHIDLAPASVRRELRRTTVAEWLLLVVGLALCAGATWTWGLLNADSAALRVELAQTNARLAQRKDAAAVVPTVLVPADRMDAVSGLIDQLNLPWSSMFAALEQADQASAAVLELTFQPRQRRLRGAAEAPDPAAMLRFLERLQSQPLLESARLIRHDHVEQDSAQPVRFEFEAVLALEAQK